MAPQRDFGDRLVDVARNEADYQWRRRVRAVVPQWALPLIPGEKGDVTTNVIREADRRYGGTIFAAVLGCAGLLFTGAATLAAAIWAALVK